MLRLLCAFVLIGSVVVAVQPPKFSTPEPDFPADDLREPGPDDKQYPLPQDEAKARKLRAERQEYFRGQFLESFTKCGSDKARGAAQGRAALEALAKRFEQRAYSIVGRKYMLEAIAALTAAMDAGCNDPLVSAYYLIYVKAPEIPLEQSETLGEYLSELTAKGAPAMPRLQVAYEQALCTEAAGRSNAAQRREAKKQLEAAIKLLPELARTRKPAAEYFALRIIRDMLQTYRQAGFGLKNGYELINDALDDSGASEYFLHMVRAYHHVDVAWDIRGTRAAVRVAEDRRKDFITELKKAESELLAAWKLDNNRPEAPTEMIALCRGLAYNRKEMEQWFQRAMAAEPDNFRACDAKLEFLDPKWGGSVPACLSFGRQCARTRNYHAGLPFVLVFAHKNIAARDFAAHLRSNETIWADVREVYEHHLQLDPADRTALTEYAVICTYVGQWHAAKQHAEALKGDFDPKVFRGQKREWDNFIKSIEKNIANK